MLALFLERLALILALSAIVLAALWPHVGPRVMPALNKFILNPITVFVFGGRKLATGRQGSIITAHPKLSGRKLTRTTSMKESIIAVALRSNNQRAPVASNPSFIQAGFPSSVNLPSHGQHGHATQTSQSSLSLTVFTGCIVAMIVYTFMKTLSARFKGPSQHIEEPDQNKGSADSYEKVRDLRYERRRLARMSEGERVRRLMKYHGGKNVSAAIRFLANELGKQKRLLTEGLSGESPCNCSCHDGGEITNPSPIVS